MSSIKIEKLSQPIFNNPYSDGLAELVNYYKGLPDVENFILTMQSIRSVVEAFYQVLVKKKEMEPIESLEEKEKLRIWKMTEGLEKGERIKASKAIYLMRKILEK